MIVAFFLPISQRSAKTDAKIRSTCGPIVIWSECLYLSPSSVKTVSIIEEAVSPLAANCFPSVLMGRGGNGQCRRWQGNVYVRDQESELKKTFHFWRQQSFANAPPSVWREIQEKQNSFSSHSAHFLRTTSDPGEGGVSPVCDHAMTFDGHSFLAPRSTQKTRE